MDDTERGAPDPGRWGIRTCSRCPNTFSPTQGNQRLCPGCRANPTYTPRSPKQLALKSTANVEAIVNIQQAIAEMTAAKDELDSYATLAAQTKLSRADRERLLCEPLARLDLARRFIVATLRTYGRSEE